ncbi:MAG: hypothetical protein R6U40_09055, partial [Desulfobacterales bacterium]
MFWTHRALYGAGKISEAVEQKNIFAVLGDKYNKIAYPHNVYAHFLLNQIRDSIDVYLEPQTFSLFDDMFYYRFLSGDRDVSLRAMEGLLFRDNGLPGALFLALLNEIRLLISNKASMQEFEHLYPRGIPYLRHYRVYFLVE